MAKLVAPQGEPFKGTAVLTSHDKFVAEGVRMEIRVTESWQEAVWEKDADGNERRVMKRRDDERFSQDVPISQGFEIGNGETREFPFEVTIPYYSPSRGGGAVAYSLKAVAGVKGRPDVTKTVSPTVNPPVTVVQQVGAAEITRVVEREVVKISCKYCGNLNTVTADLNKCSSCGAPIRIQ